jgi:hypothetical protein
MLELLLIPFVVVIAYVSVKELVLNIRNSSNKRYK